MLGKRSQELGSDPEAVSVECSSQKSIPLEIFHRVSKGTRTHTSTFHQIQEHFSGNKWHPCASEWGNRTRWLKASSEVIMCSILRSWKCTTNNCTKTYLLETLQVLRLRFNSSVKSALLSAFSRKTFILFNHVWSWRKENSDFLEHMADGGKLSWTSHTRCTLTGQCGLKLTALLFSALIGLQKHTFYNRN